MKSYLKNLLWLVICAQPIAGCDHPQPRTGPKSDQPTILRIQNGGVTWEVCKSRSREYGGGDKFYAYPTCTTCGHRIDIIPPADWDSPPLNCAYCGASVAGSLTLQFRRDAIREMERRHSEFGYNDYHHNSDL